MVNIAQLIPNAQQGQASPSGLPSTNLPTPPGQATQAPPQTAGPASTQPTQPGTTNAVVNSQTNTGTTQIPTSTNNSSQVVTIPGTNQQLTQLTPISTQDVMSLLNSQQKFPQAFGQQSNNTPSVGGEAQAGQLPSGYDPKVNYGNFIGGQCTSYAAWYWNNVLGKPFKDLGQGNAKNWPALAVQQGYKLSSTPEVNDIVSWPGIGQYGHVAIVTGVNNDGTINVSEMNYKPGQYTTRQSVPTKGAVFIK